MADRSDSADLIGRIFLCVIFILSGISKIFGWNETHVYLVSRGIPWSSGLLTIALIIEILGGLSILLGFKIRPACFILFLYLIPVTLTVHSFWNYPPGPAQNQMAHFLKNIAIMGGLLFVAAHGAGRFSLDYRNVSRRELREEHPAIKAA